MKAPKQALRSIKDVHSRLKWDGNIDTATIYIGYTDRMRGLVEIPYADFRPGGRVPWDRIQHFRMGETLIWDRVSRIDLVFGSGDTPANAVLLVHDTADEDAQVFGPGWPRVQAMGWNASDSAWSTTVTAQSIWDLAKLKLLTFNVLSNNLMPGRPRETARYQAIADFLAAEEADIIALQEVDRAMLSLLQAQPWVKAQYFLADNAGIGQERSHFELLMTKTAPQIVAVPLIEDESRSIAAKWQTRGLPFTVCCLHLFSDSGHNPAEKRDHFLQQLATQLPVDEAVLLVGDFNFGDEFVAGPLAEFTDAWLQLHPGEAGITYDGEHNILAQSMNPKARTRRIDRLFLRNADRFPFVEGIEVVEALRTDGQPLSDHRAMRAMLSFVGSFGAMRSAPKSNHSALCIIPPAELWAEIQSLRRRYDPSFSRWMPHINMVYDFLPDSYFPEAQAALQAALADVAAFEISLEALDVFEHADSTTIYLKPDAASTERLRHVQAIANGLFPQCNDVERHGMFHPHLTVAKFPHSRKKDVRRLLQEWNALWEPISFSVNRLELIARSGLRPFEVLAAANLGSSVPQYYPKHNIATTLGTIGMMPGKIATTERNIALANVQKGIHNMGDELRLFPVGSTALGTMLPGSDLDFVCIGGMPSSTFMERAPRAMEGLQFSRVVTNALVPALKLYFPGFSADLSYVQLAASFPLESPAKWDADVYAQLNEIQARALRAITDPGRLLLRAGPQRAAYLTATLALKAWAQAQRVQGNAFGYPGGFAWSLMLAQAGPHATPEAWIKAFFEEFLQRDWSGQMDGADPAPMCLLSGETPAFNITRNVSRNTLAILQNAAEEALLRIWDIESGAGKWEDLFCPSPRRANARIVLRWQANLRHELEMCSGWMQGQIFGLVQRVEAIADLLSRPDAAFIGGERLTQSYEIALLSYPDAQQLDMIQLQLNALEEDFMRQPQRPHGATIRTAIEFVDAQEDDPDA